MRGLGFLLLLAGLGAAHGASIMFWLPFTFKSAMVAYMPLVEELASRGHQVSRSYVGLNTPTALNVFSALTGHNSWIEREEGRQLAEHHPNPHWRRRGGVDAEALRGTADGRREWIRRFRRGHMRGDQLLNARSYKASHASKNVTRLAQRRDVFHARGSEGPWQRQDVRHGCRLRGLHLHRDGALPRGEVRRAARSALHFSGESCFATYLISC